MASQLTRPSLMRSGVRMPVSAPRRTVLVVRAQQQDSYSDARVKLAALPMAGLVAASLIAGAFNPEEAFAASSGGRSGGSAGFSARRAAPARSAPAQRTTTTVTSTNVVVAPPVYAAPVFSPFGFSPFGGFGFGYGVGIMPFGMFSSLFSLFFLVAILGVVFNVIRAFTSGSGKSSSKKDDGWGDL